MRSGFFNRLRSSRLPDSDRSLLDEVLWLTVSAGLCCLAGCSALPKAGPTTAEVADQAKARQRNFDLIEIDQRVIDALRQHQTEGLAHVFGRGGRPPEPRIGVGDSLTLTIWQSAYGGVPGTQGAAAISVDSDATRPPIAVPEQVIGSDGSITVPYAGRAHAVGRTAAQLQSAIQASLSQRFIEPQVIVSMGKGMSDTATIAGEAIGTARVPLSARGDRILDVIAAAGGSKTPPQETFVRLSRDGVTALVPLTALMSDPAENIYIWPGDTITVLHQPETFEVMGATPNNNEIPFGAQHINLVQALAKGGGLQDTRADPSGIYLLRFEPEDVIKADSGTTFAVGPTGLSPKVYHLDLQEISGYFLAEQFPLRNHDILYIANARSDSAQKLFSLIGSLSGPILGGAVIAHGTH